MRASQSTIRPRDFGLELLRATQDLGRVNATFNASPNSPAIAFRFARGWTLIANVTPAAVSLMESTSYMISRSQL